MPKPFQPKGALQRISNSGPTLAVLVVSVMLASLFLATSRVQTAPAEQWSVGYWTPGGRPPLPPEAIVWSALTHIIHWGALVQSDGTLDLNTQRVSSQGPALIAAGRAHGVKVLLGVTQAAWLGQTNTLQEAITRDFSTLVTNIMDVVNSYGFDGVDIDWEPFHANRNGPALRQLAAALRAELGTRLLTSAAIVNDYAFWGTVHSYFDRVQIMTYDLNGIWNRHSWHNAALYGPRNDAVWSVDMAVRRFLASGVPAAKLSIGIPFFGWRSTGGLLSSESDQGITGPQQQWLEPPGMEQLYYQRLTSLITPPNYHWDSQAQVPYLSIDNSGSADDQFISFDDPQSVAEKVKYAKSRGLGGWIIWELSGDYVPSQTPSQPLLTAIRDTVASLE